MAFFPNEPKTPTPQAALAFRGKDISVTLTHGACDHAIPFGIKIFVSDGRFTRQLQITFRHLPVLPELLAQTPSRADFPDRSVRRSPRAVGEELHNFRPKYIKEDRIEIR